MSLNVITEKGRGPSIVPALTFMFCFAGLNFRGSLVFLVCEHTNAFLLCNLGQKLRNVPTKPSAARTASLQVKKASHRLLQGRFKSFLGL